ncbi:hypothetical protein KUCAC02_035948, partial [Chaenocephalus aceratus]
MSEDEADEDACGHMDKENQQPNEPPVSDYVDIEPQQHKPTKPRGRLQRSQRLNQPVIPDPVPYGNV